MITAVSQAGFCKEFAMARGSFDPKDFGVDMTREAFKDLMVDEFNATYRNGWTIDELTLHPVEALQFCNQVRRKHGFFYAPDDIILRSIENRRKNPSG